MRRSVIGRRAAAALALAFLTLMPLPVSAQQVADTVGLIDPAQGQWHLRTASGQVASFFFGNPGDFPLMGDWDCDGIDTPGMYRQSDGFVYLRNSNTQGIGDIRFFFGNPGDIPLGGDFNGNGCDTVSIYRPSEGRAFIINELGKNEGGLGAAEFDYFFGNPGDKPFVGDFDGDGIDTIGLHRESTGFVYFRQTHTQGVADNEFFFGDPGDRLAAGDWGIVDDIDTPAIFRPSDVTFYFRHSNTQGVADSQFRFGESTWLPVAGNFGELKSAVSTFGDGTWIVGTEVPPGTYRNSDSSGFCYWARLSGFGGTFDEIITNDLTSEVAIVTIEDTDVGFESDGCGTWSSDLSPRTSSPTAPFGGGHFQVGSEIAPGTWRNNDSSGGCFWQRLSGFSGQVGDVVTNEFSTEIEIVTIGPADVGFHSEGCGTWSMNLGPRTASPTAPFGGGHYLVGSEVAPGTWRNSDSSGTCYWERLSGFSGQFSDLIANDLSSSIQTVTIDPTDVGFFSTRCGTWTKIG